MLSVSRQAVTKWETGKGLPDIENLKRISSVLGVSMDNLLDDGGSLDMSVIREPINLSDYENSHLSRVKRASKRERLMDEAALSRFPNARVTFLIHKQILTKGEHWLQALLMVGLNSAANTVEVVHSFKNKDMAFYLAEEGEKQYLVKITNDFMEIRQLAKRIEGKRFDVGEFRFIKASYAL